mmetsp:Transcript_47968/g.115242  ORF Transcript_47968/g.115242 Transcript_47968/m.115242 type:complete len:312 (-) Transcript_47968:316-1251(-)
MNRPQSWPISSSSMSSISSMSSSRPSSLSSPRGDFIAAARSSSLSGSARRLRPPASATALSSSGCSALSSTCSISDPPPSSLLSESPSCSPSPAVARAASRSTARSAASHSVRGLPSPGTSPSPSSPSASSARLSRASRADLCATLGFFPSSLPPSVFLGRCHPASPTLSSRVPSLPKTEAGPPSCLRWPVRLKNSCFVSCDGLACVPPSPTRSDFPASPAVPAAPPSPVSQRLTVRCALAAAPFVPRCTDADFLLPDLSGTSQGPPPKSAFAFPFGLSTSGTNLSWSPLGGTPQGRNGRPDTADALQWPC